MNSCCESGSPISRRSLLIGAGAAATAFALGTPAYASERAADQATGDLIDVQLLNITDFHGNLRTPTSSADGYLPDAGGNLTLHVGGAAYLATHLRRLRAAQNSFFFSIGDNYCGGEPLDNKMLSDEGPVEVLNKLGLQFSTLGNHELDYGIDYFQRHMVKGIPIGVPGRDSSFRDSTGRRYKGLGFPYYSANMVWRKTGQPVLQPYNIEYVTGPGGRRYPIGFIHLTLAHSPTGSSSYNPDLDGLDPIETANRYARLLKDRGVNALVLCVHDGAQQVDNWHAPINGSTMAAGGPALELAAKADPDICAIITGHWHWWFNAMLPDPEGNLRPFVEAGHAGQIINEINLKLDPATGKVVRDLTKATNHPVTLDVPPDPEMQRIVDYWTDLGNQRYATVAGRLTGDFTPTLNASGESTMGDLGADLMLWSANRNRQGRADFGMVAAKPVSGSNAVAGRLLYAKGANSADQDGVILYGEAYSQLGYENPILTVTLTGEQLRQAFEQQWQRRSNGTIVYGPLAFSANVRATFDSTKPIGQRVDPAKFLIDGLPLDLGRSYRVAGLAYTLIGADGYGALASFTDPYRNGRDHEEFIAYLREHEEISPSRQDRVTVIT
ncbi:bifunctional metallophosphatase/5'-nucleotidase [Microbispora sp. NPDC046933]|uniref:bifunctional metallophosphatase/5'-nucleotidase n=1 Tax=Microbispora sp. NPDC046933 TaxID=3155618 RepID=UPI0033C76258